MTAESGGAPRYRLWPPFAVGLPLTVGLLLSASPGDPWRLPGWATPVGWVLLVLFVVWNGWCLLMFANRGTGLLPGQATVALMETGPFALSRNPLYVGLLVLQAAIGLLAGSLWTLLALPVSALALHFGAVRPEEAYLRARLGAPYAAYASRVRRWL